MKKINKFIPLLFVPFLLTACENGGGSDKSSAKDGKVTIEFFGWGSAEEQQNFQTLVNLYNSTHENVKVIYDATDSGTYDLKLKNRMNNLPDVFYVPDYDFLPYADSGKLLDLTNYVTQEEINSVWEQSIEMYRYDRSTSKLGEGKLYGLPKDLGPYSLVYNKDLLKDCIARAADDGKTIEMPSDTVPMTFTTFVNYLKDLKPYLVSAANPNGYGIGYYELMDAVWSNNADFFTEDGKTSRITEKNFTDALQWVADLNLVHKVAPTAAENQSQNSYQRFLNKGCLFTFMGPWDLKAYWEGIDFEFDLMPTPKGDAVGSVSTSWVGSVAYCVKASLKSDTAKCNAAVDFAKWLTFSTESNEKMVTLGQAMPNLVSMAENEFLNNTFISPEETRKAYPEHKNVWLDQVRQSDTIKSRRRAKYYLYDGTCYDTLISNTDIVFTGAKTAAQWAQEQNATFQKGLKESQENLN